MRVDFPVLVHVIFPLLYINCGLHDVAGQCCTCCGGVHTL